MLFLEIFAALLLGIVFGIFTGLAPGIHINLVALILFIYSRYFLQFTLPIVLAVFIVSMAITHIFMDFIPSIFLGAPEESTALSVLPGHSLLLEGKGYEAVYLTSLGSYIGILILLLLTPLLLFSLPAIYPKLKDFIPLILILSSSFLILKERKGRRIQALLLFLLSGILGIFSLNFYVIKEPLFPLLTGLFGTSMLFNSIMKKTIIPEQSLETSPLSKKDIFDSVKSSIISGPLCSFLPGLGAAQAAVLGSSFSSLNKRSFLFLLGIIGTLVSGLNFLALYAIDKPRSGTAVIVGKLIELNFYSLTTLLAVMLVAGSLSLFISLHFAKVFAKNISYFNYQKTSLFVFIILTILSVLISGPYSLVILTTATSIGILCSELGVKKMHLMGCLILPVILYLIF